MEAVFFISSYGAPLVQRASYLALHSSRFGPVVQLIMIILSLTALTLFFWPKFQNLSKTLMGSLLSIDLLLTFLNTKFHWLPVKNGRTIREVILWVSVSFGSHINVLIYPLYKLWLVNVYARYTYTTCLCWEVHITILT